MRRWASRAGEPGPEHDALHGQFIHLKKALGSNQPPNTTHEYADEELEATEGQLRRYFIVHRKREAKLRGAKLRAVLKANNGRIDCQVPGCGFDFAENYGGELGFGYAQVHHIHPLNDAKNGRRTTLEDLAVVCANCHVMIHRGGACRPLEGLIDSRRRKA